MSILGSGMEASTAVEVLLARLEGKIDLIQSGVDGSKADIRDIRQRVHDVSGEVQKIIALNVPGKLDQHTGDIEKLAAKVLVLETDLNMRRGAVTLARVLWGLGGAGIAGGGLVVARMIGAG